MSSSGIRRGLSRVERGASRETEALASVTEARIAGHERLDDQRWDSHSVQHTDLAASLAEYKSAANEWRATLSDLRQLFLTKAEFAAEHRALASDIQGDMKGMSVTAEGLAAKVAALDQARLTREASDAATAVARADQQRRDEASRARAQWTIGVAVAITSILVSVTVTIIIRVLTGP